LWYYQKWEKLFWFLWIGVLLWGSVPAFSAEPPPPRRIISLSPAHTEAIYQLGEEDKLVGVTTFCLYPPQARAKEKIGTLLEPNMEKMVTLKPDLVLATELNPQSYLQKLRSLGLKVVVFPPEKTLNQIMDNFRSLGRIIGAADKAEKIIRDSRQRIEAVQKRVRGAPKIRVFWEVGAFPLVTVARDTFVDELIDLAGGINIAHDLKGRYIRYSREEVIRQNPEVIILISMGEVSHEELGGWKKFKDLKAVRQNRLYIMEAHIVSSPTPLTFTKGLEQVARFLFPDRFPQ
jgi:iron complex transport system substrate-binding protein